MKKLMIALAILGITCSGGLEAQTCHTAKKAKMHKLAKITQTKTTNLANTYQVCKQENGFYTCCVYKNSSTALKSW